MRIRDILFLIVLLIIIGLLFSSHPVMQTIRWIIWDLLLVVLLGWGILILFRKVKGGKKPAEEKAGKEK